MANLSKHKNFLQTIVFILISTFTLGFSNIGLSIVNAGDVKVAGSDLLKVHYIDVGQADAIFIDYGDYDILIDGGNNEDGTAVVNYLKSLGTDDIEIMVATHPHEDHIGGLDDVLNAFKVEKVIDSGLEVISQTYKSYIAAVNNEVGVEFLEDADMSFELGSEAVFKVIEAGDASTDANERSVVTLLDYNNVEFLFTGDLESNMEDVILNKGIDADLLKVGHHGSKTSSSEALLQKVTPEVAIISAGENNSYGHPHEEVLNRIAKYTNRIYGTWLSGTIVVSSDGNTYNLSTDQTITSQSVTIPPVYDPPASNPPSTSSVEILSVDLEQEIVTLKNTGLSDVNLSDWTIRSVVGNQTYSFPTGFVLRAGSTVKVLSGNGAYEDGVSALKWTGSYIWNNDGDPAELIDQQGNVISNFPRTDNSTPQGFTDIQAHWAKNDIELMASKGVVTGKTATTFAPDDKVTRAEFATLLVRALGLSPYTGPTGQFTDVLKANWYFGTVEAAARAGIITGYGNGKFGANDNITREQMAVMIVRAMAVEDVKADLTTTEVEQLLQRFADRSKIQSWANEGIAKGVYFGIINGITANTFAPEKNASRAEAVTMIKRMMEKTNLL